MLHMNLLAMSNPGGGGSSGAGLIQLAPIALVFLVMWFMLIKPQRKQQAQRKTMIASLKRGDKIVTNGGLFAEVRDVKNDRVVAVIAEGVKVEISKQSVNGVLEEE